MGIYDREYYREEGSTGWSSRSVVINLIIANVVVFFLQQLLREGDQSTLENWLALRGDFFSHPWEVWRLVTYGFLHGGLGHIFFNMYALWLFGMDIESRYGKAEFLRFYLATLVIAALIWLLIEAAMGGLAPNIVLIGASGAITGVMILYVLHFPERTILFWGVVPMKVWVLGALYVALDVFGAMNRSGSTVAHVAHLGGAGFGFLYVRQRFNLGRLVPTDAFKALARRGPKLKIHNPDTARPDLSKQVDEILEKISREGESSLTRQERKTLEEASRQYQRRRR
jgi:membrane associated rhomboid family serine protease